MHEIDRVARAIITRRQALGIVPAGMCQACRGAHSKNAPSIVFTRVPQADAAGSSRNDIIEGRGYGRFARRKDRSVREIRQMVGATSHRSTHYQHSPEFEVDQRDAPWHSLRGPACQGRLPATAGPRFAAEAGRQHSRSRGSARCRAVTVSRRGFQREPVAPARGTELTGRQKRLLAV